MRILWSTRGRSWGFRFLRNDGFGDPLPVYESAFRDVGNAAEAWGRFSTDGLSGIALRFPDPEGRVDGAGRAIPHEFVIVGESSEAITSFDEGRSQIWPLVRSDFDAVWSAPDPSVEDERSAKSGEPFDEHR